MSKFSTFISLCKKGNGIGRAFMEKFSRTKISHIVPDKAYLKIQYRLMMGKKLNLKNPQTFNEKLQWIKLYDRKKEYITMVDKYEVKKYIASKIGDEYVIPTLGVWEHFDDIDFDALPNQFVLKTTHDSGSIFICRDKNCFDKKTAKEKMGRSLARNFYYYGREWPYKNVKPRIIAEKYMVDESSKELRDYKFFCFGGICKCMKVDFDRFIAHRANYYNVNGALLDFGEVVCPPDLNKSIVIPQSKDKMIQLAEILSKDIPFLRVDFYDVNGKIYFGELTFFPATGLGAFTQDKWDFKFGSWIALPER